MKVEWYSVGRGAQSVHPIQLASTHAEGAAEICAGYYELGRDVTWPILLWMGGNEGTQLGAFQVNKQGEDYTAHKMDVDQGATLDCLGVGSAFASKSLWQSNFLLRRGDSQGLLVDCGSDVRHALEERRLGIGDIESAYISHAHADHAGGLEWLAFYSYFSPQDRPKLISHDLDALWEQSLRGGLETLSGQEVATLETYFDPLEIETGFSYEGIRIQTVKLCHINGEGMLSYGIKFKVGDDRVFITTDMAFAGNIPEYRDADIILQDCETLVGAKSGVHPHYEELLTLPDEIRAKMWLYHYQSGVLPDACAAGFRGFLHKGQRLVFGRSVTLAERTSAEIGRAVFRGVHASRRLEGSPHYLTPGE